MYDFERAHKEAPHLPWNNVEPRDLGDSIMQFCYDQESYIRKWAQKWFENFQFVYGNHHLKWSRRYDFAVESDFLRREPAINQQSQTNIARTVAEALASLLCSNKPEWDVETTEESYNQSKRFQRIVTKILECYNERIQMFQEIKAAAMCFAVYGKMVMKIDHDYSTGKIVEIPRFKKIKVPLQTTTMAETEMGLVEVPTEARNSQGEPMWEERWMPEVDGEGKQIIDRQFHGDVRVTNLTPFEYQRETGVSGAHKAKWVRQIRIIDYDDWLGEYSNVGGKTEFFDQVKPGNMNGILHNFAVRQYMRMNYVTPANLMHSRRSTDTFSRTNLFKHKVIVVEHYDRPHPKMWPKGRKVIVANGMCTHISEPQYTTNKLGGWHPFVERQWMFVPPAGEPSAPINDVISKNRELNVADSLIITAMHRNMGSALLLKSGSGLDSQRFSGTPGQILECADPDTAARFLHDETPIHPVVNQLRNNFKDDIYETSGAQDSLRGDRSKGVSSGYQLKQLEEREQKRISHAKDQFDSGISEVGEKVIACLRSMQGADIDSDVIGFLKRSASGEFSEQDIVAFLKTSIDFGVDVKVVKGSMNYKSKATIQATLLELAKGPAGSRLAQNAKVLDTFLKYFDAETLRDGSATHRDRAVRENEMFVDIGKLGPEAKASNMPVVLHEDDHDIHIDEHIDDLLKHSEGVVNNPFEMELRIFHIEWHKQMKKEQMGELPPGTSTQFSTTYAQAKQNAPAPVAWVYQQRDAQKTQEAQDLAQKKFNDEHGQQTPAQAVSSKQAPQAPREPGAPGAPGPNPQTAGAPSANTQTAKNPSMGAP